MDAMQKSGIIHPFPSSTPGQLIMSFIGQIIGHDTGHSYPLLSRGPSNP